MYLKIEKKHTQACQNWKINLALNTSMKHQNRQKIILDGRNSLKKDHRDEKNVTGWRVSRALGRTKTPEGEE